MESEGPEDDLEKLSTNILGIFTNFQKPGGFKFNVEELQQIYYITWDIFVRCDVIKLVLERLVKKELVVKY